MGLFVPEDHVTEVTIPNRGRDQVRFVSTCPECGYKASSSREKEPPAASLLIHWNAKHAQSTEPVVLTVVEDERTSHQRIEDVVFEARIKDLTHRRRWDELNLVQLVYASILTDREADDG